MRDMDNIDTTTAVEAISEEVRAQRAIRVIQHQVQHGSSVRQACEACNVPVRTFYHWMREGVLTDYVGASRDSRSTVASALAIEAIPDVMQYMIAIATGKVQVRGANPVAAARFVLSVAGITEDTSAAEDRPPTTNIFLPEMVTLNLVAAAHSVPPDDPPEALEGSYEEVER